MYFVNNEALRREMEDRMALKMRFHNLSQETEGNPIEAFRRLEPGLWAELDVIQKHFDWASSPNMGCVLFALYYFLQQKIDLVSEGAQHIVREEKSFEGLSALDLIDYYDFKEGGPLDVKHSAIYLGKGRAISKWGNQGNIYEHPFNVFPATYGSYLRFFDLRME